MTNEVMYKRQPLAKIINRYGIKSIHPVADLFPMYSDEQFQIECLDIDKNGFLNSIKVTDDGVLLDGRNRLQIGNALGLDPVIEKINPPDPIAYIISENIMRRHLTPWELARLGESLAEIRHGGDRKSKEIKITNATLIDREQAAKMVGTTPQAISDVRLIRDFAPQEIARLDSGQTTMSAARKIASVKRKSLYEKQKNPDQKANMIALHGIVEKKSVLIPYPEPKGKHTFNATNQAVDWASWTWNPVTGCLHGCPYCYAREMAYRDSYKASYPIQFAPLFHHERLDDPVNTVPGNDRPQDGRVFVCSMADLFGEWVPQDWIDQVFESTLRAPQWEYLFLTKFPQRYRRINLPPKAWFGASVDQQKRVKTVEKHMPDLAVKVRWLSIEPLLEPLEFNDLSWCDLMVIGAQSETQQPFGYVPAFAPEVEWVISLIAQAREFGVPVYMKPNLLGIPTGAEPGMKLIQELPRKR